MVWGGISWEGKTKLHVIDGKLDSAKYCNILKGHKSEMKEMFGNNRRWWFQQDGAPCHSHKKTKVFIKRNLTSQILPHPPQSPDLNPIELIWARMKQKVELRRPKTKEDLKRAVLASWDEIDKTFIRKCIGTIQKNMKK